MKVAECQFSLNTTVKTSTGMSPHRLITGQEALTELEVELNQEKVPEQTGKLIPLVPDTLKEPECSDEDRTKLEMVNPQSVEDIVLNALDRNKQIEETNQQELELAQVKRPLEQLLVTILQDPIEQREERMKEEKDVALANIEMKQEKMVDSKPSLMNLKYGKGDLVYLDKHMETRTVPEKSGTQTYGPYRVRGYGWVPEQHGTHEQNCPLCSHGMKEFGGPSPYLVVENPWVGPTSEFMIHEEDARKWDYPLPSIRELAVSEDIQLSKLNKRSKNIITKVCKFLQIPEDELSYLDLIGKRVVVKWTKQQGAAGNWAGTVIDYEPFQDRHWIKYDIPGEDGDDTYPQNLISTNASSNWWFDSTQNLVLQVGGGGVTNSPSKHTLKTPLPDQLLDQVPSTMIMPGLPKLPEVPSILKKGGPRNTQKSVTWTWNLAPEEKK
jgi:hypothetical protein